MLHFLIGKQVGCIHLLAKQCLSQHSGFAFVGTTDFLLVPIKQLGKATLIMAHVTFSMPYVMVIISASLAEMGRELEEAAQDLGATPWGTLRHVTLPLITPGIVAGFLMSFTLSLDDFIISFFVAGPNSTTLPLYIYGLVKRGVSPEVNALSTLLIVCTVLLVIVAELFRRKDSKSITL